ncbi:MAG: maleylpyruvate isomerase N-terminal domain-containing protein [Acidimicrobiales bacterium]
MTTRSAFLASARLARAVIAEPSVAERWEQASALPEFTVRGLAGHLGRAVWLVNVYLDAEPPGPEAAVLSAPHYFTSLPISPDLSSELNRAVRERGESEAEAGVGAVLARLDDAIAVLERRLEDEPADRTIAAIAGLVLRLDDYLVTRLVELIVHLDDLAVSVGAPTPDLPAEATEVTIDCLLQVSRGRHGDLAVVRAMARRERDTAEALRVF